METLDTLNSFKTGEIILGGDFNCIVNDKLDKSVTIEMTPSNSLPQRPSKLEELLTQYSLTDISRVQHPSERDYLLLREASESL